MTTYVAALTTRVHEEAIRHLLATPYQEDLCFALWNPSRGATRTSALIERLVLPLPGERELHGNVSFSPNYFERALGEAVAAGTGLAFIHSHVGPGWQGMSTDDVIAETRIAPAARGATGLPLVGLTLGTDGAWSARFWEKCAAREYERRWCDRVRVVGDYLSLTYCDELTPRPAIGEELSRTVSAWGSRVQGDITRLVVGVVGVGSVGSIVAESLARMGFVRVKLIDFDRVERVNRDRILHASFESVGALKVQMLADVLPASATATEFVVDAVEYSVVEQTGFQAALDCDVLFGCVDRPWGRHVLNAIAYAHLIPVVDGGIRAEPTKSHDGLRRADMRAHVATPGRACLECLGQYDSGMVSLERDGYLDDPVYIQGLSDDDPARRNENVFAFSIQTAGLQLAQFLSMAVRPLGIGNAGASRYHLVTNTLEAECDECKPLCIFDRLTAKGDRSGMTFTGRHLRAELERAGPAKSKESLLTAIGTSWSLLRARILAFARGLIGSGW